MNINHYQFESIKSLCSTISRMPGKKAELTFIGNFDKQKPVIKIKDRDLTYSISDDNTDKVINSLCNYLIKIRNYV